MTDAQLLHVILDTYLEEALCTVLQILRRRTGSHDHADDAIAPLCTHFSTMLALVSEVWVRNKRGWPWHFETRKIMTQLCIHCDDISAPGSFGAMNIRQALPRFLDISEQVIRALPPVSSDAPDSEAVPAVEAAVRNGDAVHPHERRGTAGNSVIGGQDWCDLLLRLEGSAIVLARSVDPAADMAQISKWQDRPAVVERISAAQRRQLAAQQQRLFTDDLPTARKHLDRLLRARSVYDATVCFIENAQAALPSHLLSNWLAGDLAPNGETSSPLARPPR
ncbi:hypothetical protein CXG81DRAFT_23321 [Caulochytrium protostelioides]|uniref:Uncharacterized protein n=1 Tax=Caulochytrium protostelioides TaxID=1555241 RepID=A0A4P9XET9_9FUNG|nr:hypothetical protein CXG81DRAFT_23321 [Caulochytrium protostelioides]|eukprot:RKP04064.1 hypothetical protein CXG81DRAFT_23321 [Caulochytrium protostelioides]